MNKNKLIAAVAGLLAAIALVVPALSGPATAADTSQVYVVHGIPATPVDVYVNGSLTLTAFQPEDVQGPLDLPAGSYRVQIFAATDGPSESAPASGAVIDKTLDVPGGASLSLIAHLDASGAPVLTAFANDGTEVGAGMARVSVRHTAAAPAVDIYVDGAKAVSALSNPDEAVAEIPAGSHTVEVKAAGTDTTVIGPATLDFAEGTNTLVFAIGSLEAKTLGVVTQVLDVATGAATTTSAPATPTTMPSTMPAPAPAAPTQGQPAYTG
jgi:hypothetical protein